MLCVPYARGRLYSIGSKSVLVDFTYPIRSLELDPGPPATGTAAYPGLHTTHRPAPARARLTVIIKPCIKQNPFHCGLPTLYHFEVAIRGHTHFFAGSYQALIKLKHMDHDASQYPHLTACVES